MCRKALIALLLAFSMNAMADDRKVIQEADGSITFVVDEGLEPIEERHKYLFDGEQIAKQLLNEDKTILGKVYNVVASSFAEATCLRISDKDAFYQTVLEAYKKHKSLVLSPDMIWLHISQGFARYVNAHSETLRPLLVEHSGKMDLDIETELDLCSDEADIPRLVEDFASKIEAFTKDSIAQTITSDFSTTGLSERVASQITLMESVKSYFEYRVIYASCGIPSITLKGTPTDWKRVMEKTQRLSRYGLTAWTNSLLPILGQFVCAAEGHPEQKFWQSIVKRERVEHLEGGGCSNKTPTRVDGWLLKLFPDENGEVLDSAFHTKNMPSERVYVGLKYRRTDGAGNILSEEPMELMAGFIGAEEDTISHTLTPRIGWLLRRPENDADLLADLEKKSKGRIDIKVKEVPEVLRQIEHINSLSLAFTDAVVLPEWFRETDIDHLEIFGSIASIDDLPQVLDKISWVSYLDVNSSDKADACFLHLRGSANRQEAQAKSSDKARHIEELSLELSDNVQLPEWISGYDIDRLIISASLTKAQKKTLSKRLRKANVKRVVFREPSTPIGH